MRTIKLIIEYDGTNYAGWQVQPNGLAVQQVVEEALGKLLKVPVRVYSSGRTDAGVHARGMVAAFRTDQNLPLQAFAEGLNTLLPNDIAVQDAAEAPVDFNPRSDALAKHYRYTIYCGRRRSPLTRLYSWHLKDILDIRAMREGAAFFVGEHDFALFRTAGCAAMTTIRRIDSVDISVKGATILIDVEGSGFLRNMVRIMVGTLVEIGRGKRSACTVQEILSGNQGIAAGPTAPSRGLCLMEVMYESKVFLDKAPILN